VREPYSGLVARIAPVGTRLRKVAATEDGGEGVLSQQRLFNLGAEACAEVRDKSAPKPAPKSSLKPARNPAPTSSRGANPAFRK